MGSAVILPIAPCQQDSAGSDGAADPVVERIRIIKKGTLATNRMTLGDIAASAGAPMDGTVQLDGLRPAPAVREHDLMPSADVVAMLCAGQGALLTQSPRRLMACYITNTVGRVHCNVALCCFAAWMPMSLCAW